MQLFSCQRGGLHVRCLRRHPPDRFHFTGHRSSKQQSRPLDSIHRLLYYWNCLYGLRQRCVFRTDQGLGTASGNWLFFPHWYSPPNCLLLRGRYISQTTEGWKLLRRRLASLLKLATVFLNRPTCGGKNVAENKYKIAIKTLHWFLSLVLKDDQCFDWFSFLGRGVKVTCSRNV